MAASAHVNTASPLTPRLTLDLNGRASPGPLPSLRRAMNDLKAGEVLLLVSDYPGIEGDLLLWARQTSNPLMSVDRSVPRGFGFYVMKGDPWPASHSLDMLHQRCPTPVIAVAKSLATMSPGEVIKLISNCSAAPAEVGTWLKSTPHRLLGMTEDIEGVYRFYIRC